jgi:hypothetical protein
MVLFAVKTAGMALAMNYGVHVGASLGYTKFCMPQSVWDIGQSLVSTASPVCSFLLNTMHVTQSNYAGVITTTLVGIAAGILRSA